MRNLVVTNPLTESYLDKTRKLTFISILVQIYKKLTNLSFLNNDFFVWKINKGCFTLVPKERLWEVRFGE